MAPCAHPSFFKTINDQTRPYLEIPYDFYVTYLNSLEMRKMKKDPIVRYVKGGYKWTLKIEKVGANYCFTDGWLEIVKDADLQVLDMIVFWIVNDSSFEVAFYNQNGCEKFLPPRDKDEDGDSDDAPDADHDDPYFVMIISKKKNCLRLPKKFVGLPGIESNGRITMKNQEGKEWELGVRLDASYLTEKYSLSPGWSEFKRSNKLTEGDECVFKFITSESKLCLAKVTKKDKVTEKNPDTQVVAWIRGPQARGRVDVETEVQVVKRGRFSLKSVVPVVRGQF